MTDEAGKRHWSTVCLAHEKTALDDIVKLRVGTSGQELVELDHKAKIDIIALRVPTDDLPPVPVANINTLIENV